MVGYSGSIGFSDICLCIVLHCTLRGAGEWDGAMTGQDLVRVCTYGNDCMICWGLEIKYLGEAYTLNCGLEE